MTALALAVVASSARDARRLACLSGGRSCGPVDDAAGPRFTSAFDVSSTDGSGAVVMSDVHNRFGLVLPHLVEALAQRTWA
jgi:hypothetical protein